MTDQDQYADLDHELYDFENCPTRTDKFAPYSERDVIAAIRKTNSNYTMMANLLGRNRVKVRAYVLANPRVKQEFDDTRERRLDMVEEAAFKVALGEDGAMIRYMLSTLGKDRGYTTRVENTGPNGGPMEMETKITQDADEFTSRIASIAARRAEASGTGETEPGDSSGA